MPDPTPDTARLPIVIRSGQADETAAHAVVLASDLPHLSVFRWLLLGTPGQYRAVRHDRQSGGGSARLVYLQHEVYVRHLGEVPATHVVVPRDADFLNCVPANLKVITRAEVPVLRSLRRDSSTGFKGVSFLPKSGLFQAQRTIGYRTCPLGRYPAVGQAAYAYNYSHVLLYPDFPIPNAIPPDRVPDEEIRDRIEGHVRRVLKAKGFVP